MDRRKILLGLFAMGLAGCVSSPKKKPPRKKRQPIRLSKLQADGIRREILLYTLCLLDIDYKFGGNNPAAGLDCSGMVVYIYKNVVKIDLPRSAADIAAVSTPISNNRMQVGDLVFFNTIGRSFSHMGLYIGDNKFVHAPKTNSVIQVEYLSTQYFASRYEGARTLFEL